MQVQEYIKLLMVLDLSEIYNKDFLPLYIFLGPIIICHCLLSYLLLDMLEMIFLSYQTFKCCKIALYFYVQCKYTAFLLIDLLLFLYYFQYMISTHRVVLPKEKLKIRLY